MEDKTPGPIQILSNTFHLVWSSATVLSYYPNRKYDQKYRAKSLDRTANRPKFHALSSLL